MQPLMESCVAACRAVAGKQDLRFPKVYLPFLGDAGGGDAPAPKRDVSKRYAAEKAWCRIHNAERCALFTPCRVAGAPTPEISSLSGSRVCGSAHVLASAAVKPWRWIRAPPPRIYGLTLVTHTGPVSHGPARLDPSRRGCAASVLPYSADKVKAIPAEGEPDGELVERAASALMKILYIARGCDAGACSRQSRPSPPTLLSGQPVATESLSSSCAT